MCDQEKISLPFILGREVELRNIEKIFVCSLDNCYYAYLHMYFLGKYRLLLISHSEIKSS